ncbi:DUF2798 domain-containing protein [Leisingera daeponensis]|uniref:DUF2798 domain-containing protein n=1 Tax=Leisingera daeponensis TaxID=405746 RepID=UPI001C988E82|nr:DUF2798 domain-containing protein [Leisingera daeponensis]MBY6057509.1 DUF2798 domain-containing protein [Leisingera daeponensis]
MLPARFAPVLFALLLSGMMSCIVSGIATLRVTGLDGFAAAWMAAWSVSWPVAFPAVLVVAPVARRLVARLVRQPSEG